MNPITMPTLDAGDRRAVELKLQVLDLQARTESEWLLAEETEEQPLRSDHVRKGMRLNQPLLVIAQGGTGRVIATSLKAGFIEMYGSVPENVRFLAFDSANEPVDRQESRSGRIVRLEPEGEFFLYDRTLAASIKQHPERHRTLVNRLGNTLYKIRRPSIYNGAVQERPQGWLAFAWSYSLVRRQGEVCSMGAQSMVMLLGTDVGQKETMDSINARYALDKDRLEDDDNYLSTVGQAVLRFPARIVAKRCTLRHALAMISDYLLAPVKTTQESALRPLGGIDNLRERLQTDEHDAPYWVELIPPASLEQINPEEVPNGARALHRNFLDRRIHNDVFVGMKNKAAVLEPELRRTLEGELAVLVERAQTPLIQRWLEVTHQSLESRIAAWNADLDRLAEQIDGERVALESAATALDQAAASFSGLPFADGLRRSRVRPVLALYIDEVNRAIATSVEQRATELGVELLRRLLLWAEDQQRTVQMVALCLQQTKDRLALRENELAWLTGGRHEINLADEELVSELYREHAGQIEPFVQEAIATTGGLFTWTQLRPDQLGSLLAQSASVAFRPVREISVEQILKRRWGERSLQGWVSQLESLAASAWNLDSSLLPGGSGLADFTLLGVPDANNTLFTGADRTLISTYDNERITLLSKEYP